MDHWKSLRTHPTTVLAAFPQTEETPVQVLTPPLTTQFTAFREFHRGGRKYLGSHTFEVEGAPAAPPEREFSQALQQAEDGDDPWYPLRVDQDSALGSKTSTLSKQELAQWVQPIQELLHEASQGQDFLLQKEFIRLTREEVRYRDSWGRDLSDVRYSGFVEVFLLPTAQPQTQPHHGELHFSEFSPTMFRSFLQEQGRLTCGSYLARPWTPPAKEFPVLIRGQAVQQVFAYVLRQLSGAAVYSGVSSLEHGANLWGAEPQGDRLTMHALGLLYDSYDTALFDDQGVVLKPRVLVTEGKVENFLTNQQTAHWLALPLTGMNRNVSVSPGTVDLHSLSNQSVLEIHRLRTADIDQASGRFVAEVELADWHENGQKTPVYGFSLQGNLREALLNSRFSQEIGTWETYEGPEFILVSSSFIMEGR